MKTPDTLPIAYAATIFPTVTILSFLDINQIEVYVALFAIEFFILSELISPKGPGMSRRRTVVGIILVVAFVGIVFGRIIEVIMQTQP